MNKCIKIALLGYGTVGKATFVNLRKLSDLYSQKLGVSIEVSTIFVRNIEKYRSKVEDPSILTDDFSSIIQDPNISIVVELIGGVDVAFDFVGQALKASKCVVTANKALVAAKGVELDSIQQESGAKLYFEASVAGGIPIINVLQKSLVSNDIIEINGILNGTCNYILSRMTVEKLDYKEVLEDAVKLGYAEADPTFDVEGIDAAHKIIILGGLAFGKLVNDKDMKNIMGISSIRSHDIDFANKLGFKIKLVGSANVSGGHLNLCVEPCLTALRHPLATVDGVLNAVSVESFPVGQTMYVGPGAGGDPTSSAVLSDIYQCTSDLINGVKSSASLWKKADNTDCAGLDDQVSRFYMRLWLQDKSGVLSKVSGILGSQNVGIASVIQTQDFDSENLVPVFILTHECKRSELLSAFNQLLNSNEITMKNSLWMRVLE